MTGFKRALDVADLSDTHCCNSHGSGYISGKAGNRWWMEDAKALGNAVCRQHQRWNK